MTNLQVSPEAAANELILRRKARRGILDFTKYTYPRYIPDLFHHLMGEALDLVIRGQLPRLIVSAPPQHGKSELFSVRLPAKWVGDRPTDPIILSSYDASLAHSKAKQARRVVESQEFGYLYPHVRTMQDSRASDLWSVEQGGQVRSAGVGGGLTGHPGLLGIIDDPVKNRKEAESQVIRDGIWEWWTSTYRTRIWEGGQHVLIMTRWHWDDLAGRLIANQGAMDWSEWIEKRDAGQKWVLLRCPAIAETQWDRDQANVLLGLQEGLPDPLNREPGMPLSPSRFSLETLKAIEWDVGPRDWAALYQGVPRPVDGNFFEVDKINYSDRVPMMQRVIRYWDLAATKDAGARSSGFKLGLAIDGSYWMLDWIGGHLSPAEVERTVQATAEQDGRGVEQWFEQEPGSAGKFVKHHFLGLLSGYSVWFDKVQDSKAIRWGPCASQMAGGKFYSVYAQWNREVEEELLMQPDAPLKDITDSLSGAFAQLHEDRRITSDNIDFFTPVKDRKVIQSEPLRSDAEVEKMLAQQDEMIKEITNG